MTTTTRRPTPWRALAAILAAVIIAAGLVAFDFQQASATEAACPPGSYCTNAYPDPSGYGVSGDLTTAEVIMVGDSLANGCRLNLREAFTDAGVTSAIGYWSGRPTSNGVTWALSLTRKPPVLVMELGSNDWANPSVMPAEIARLLAGVPEDTQVMWIDTYNGNQLLATGWINQGIWGSGVPVVPWYRWFAQKPSRDPLYLRDKLHPSVPPGPGCAFMASVVVPSIVATAKAAR